MRNGFVSRQRYSAGQVLCGVNGFFLHAQILTRAYLGFAAYAVWLQIPGPFRYFLHFLCVLNFILLSR
jgi:hypothetical protein